MIKLGFTHINRNTRIQKKKSLTPDSPIWSDIVCAPKNFAFNIGKYSRFTALLRDALGSGYTEVSVKHTIFSKPIVYIFPCSLQIRVSTKSSISQLTFFHFIVDISKIQSSSGQYPGFWLPNDGNASKRPYRMKWRYFRRKRAKSGVNAPCQNKNGKNAPATQYVNAPLPLFFGVNAPGRSW